MSILFIRFKGGLRAVKNMVCSITPSFWGRVRILCDFAFCKVFLGCNMEEYRLYGFYKYKNTYRKGFILKKHKKTRLYSMNPTRFALHKKEAYKLIRRGIKRELLYLPEAGEQQFLEFVRKHKKVITKPDIGSLGWNVKLFEYTNDAEALAYFHSLKRETICEEYIIQHEKMSSLNPSSVNSVRVVTLFDDGELIIMGAFLRMGGKADSVVDNICDYGIAGVIDPETGVVISVGRDYHDHTFIYHPVTSTQIVGFTIPLWKETLELIRQTHQDIAQCPHLGWDVAITPNGPEIIEINDRPGPKLTQGMDQIPKKKYLVDYLRKHKRK